MRGEASRPEPGTPLGGTSDAGYLRTLYSSRTRVGAAMSIASAVLPIPDTVVALRSEL